jgi:hypothetical protein
MYIVILAVIWIAVLSPIIIRRLRDQDTDRSIVNFHERMARLGGQNPPLVAPAHRLDVSDETPPRELLEYEVNPPTRAPHLRVVPVNATRTQIEQEMSWDEWSIAYSDDPFEQSSPVRSAVSHANPRAAAYSRVPAGTVSVAAPTSSPYGSRTQRMRRRNTLLSLIAAVVVSTASAAFLGSTVVEIAAMVSWFALLSFLGLMYYAMTTGLISAPVSSRSTAPPRTSPRVRYNEFDRTDDASRANYGAYEDERHYAQAL